MARPPVNAAERTKTAPHAGTHGTGPRLLVKAGREKSLLRRHPWVFSGAIERQDGVMQAGDTVAIEALDGRFLGRAIVSPDSQIRARVWSWSPTERVDEALIAARIERALARRARVLPASTSLRLLHG